MYIYIMFHRPLHIDTVDRCRYCVSYISMSMCTSTISISMHVYMWQKNVIVEKRNHSSHASALHHLLSSSIFWCYPNWYRIYRYLLSTYLFYIQIPQPLSNREGPYSDCKCSTTKFVCQTSRNCHQHQATKFILDASAPNGTKWTSSGRYYILNTQEFCSIKSCLKLWRPLLSTCSTCV